MREFILLFIIGFSGVAVYQRGYHTNNDIQQVLGDTEYCVNRMLESNQPYQTCFSDYYTLTTGFHNYVHSL